MKNILIMAAENSAENYAVQILQEFRKHNAPVRFFGVGGDKMASEGVELTVHNKELAVVGIIEVVSSILKLRRIMKRLLKTALERNVDAVLLIDYPDFNLRLAAKFKKAGIPVYYYISPTVWAWRYGRVNTIRKVVDHLFIIFPFEIPIYKQEKIPFTYTGHPLVPIIKVTEKKDDFKSRWHVPEGKIVVTLLPGSRRSEVNFLLPKMLGAIEKLSRHYRMTFFLLKADSIDQELLDSHLEKSSVPLQVVSQQERYNLLNASDIILTTCGTSNLEIAVIGVPFTAVYQVNKLSYFLGKRFVKIDLYSIVNILSGKEVIKELIQENFTSKNIVTEMRRILDNPEVQREMQKQFEKLRVSLQQDHNPPQIIYEKIAKDLEILDS